MNRPPSSPLACLLAAIVVFGSAVRCSAEEPPRPAAAANPPKPAGKAPVDDPPPVARDPAGMVRFPGGKARIGIDRKQMDEFIKGTDLGRMSHTATAIENEFSLSTPEHFVVLPAYWIGKYEVTNAQWHRFLESAAKLTYTVPETGSPGARTLDEISKAFLISPRFRAAGGTWFHPTAVSWRGLYDLNEEAVNPSVGTDGKPLEAAARPKPESFKDSQLRPGLRLTVYRWTVPLGWSVNGKLRGSPPPGRENQPVTGVSLVDAIAFASYYGRHVPQEPEWEAAARGPGGEMWPWGEWNPVVNAWKGFNNELEKHQAEARKALPAARNRLAEAERGGNPATLAQRRDEVARLQWIVDASPLPDPIGDPPVVDVGMFPFSRSPCGALDMVGNVDEWVSTRLYPYPGTDSNSIWKEASKAFIFRGGNLLDKEAIVEAVFRKFLVEGNPIPRTYKAASGGFRVARYDAPGASAALRAVLRTAEVEPCVYPRETDPKSKVDVGPDVDVYAAVGIERLDEADWNAAGSPANDPAGKVFLTGPARSVCLVPATGIPFKDADALRKAANAAEVPQAGKDSKKADERQPRDIPFLGLLHISEGVDVKGTVQTEVVKKVPLTEEERKAFEDRWKAERKAKEDAGKDDAGGEEKKPPEGEKMLGSPEEKKKDDKKDKKKGGDKGKKGEKPADEGDKKGGDAPADPPADAADEPKSEDEDKDEEAPTFPTHKEVKEIEYRGGFVKGDAYPGGLLLGLQRHGDGIRACLWEARPGNVGSRAPGGTVLLELPLALLPPESVDFKKVGKAGTGTSSFEPTEGKVKLVFYVPIEGAKGAAFEVTLKLQLGEFPPHSADKPWLVVGGQASPGPK